MQIEFRSALPADVPFVVDSWLESFRLSHAAGPIPMEDYKSVYGDLVIPKLLKRPCVRSVVAYNSDDPEQVFGYAVSAHHPGQPPILHYLYVKNFCRRMGIASRLLASSSVQPAEPFIYTFKTPAASKLAQKWTGCRFDPLVARFPCRSH